MLSWGLEILPTKQLHTVWKENEEAKADVLAAKANANAENA